MTNIRVFYVDYHAVFYIHSSTIVLIFTLLFVGFERVFMAEVGVFYDFVHFVGKIDFVAETHP
ncbi:hypothetical protein Hanom_Chr12g01168281 [Helianthus anomalus]